MPFETYLSYSVINIQIIHSSEGISRNYPHKVPLEQSNTPEAAAEGVWTVLKVPSVGILLMPEQNAVYYLLSKIMFYLLYKMILYNMILLMTGH